MADAIRIFRGSLSTARLAMQLALTEIDSEELAREPGEGMRSIESLLGEATIALREGIEVVGREIPPEIPDGFAMRYARWGTRAELNEAEFDLVSAFW